MFDDLICLAATALVISDGVHEVGRPSVMEEEDALSDAPERSGSELVGAGTTLRDAVGEAFAHVVDEKVRVKIRSLIGKRSARAGRGAAGNLCAGDKGGCMAMDTAYPCKSGASFLAGRCGGSGRGRAEHAHEVGKRFDVRKDRRVRTAGGSGSRREVECVLRSGVKETARRFVALLREKLVGVTPISTLYASLANRRRDLFCAFHPKRVMVPSFALRFTFPLRCEFACPEIPKDDFMVASDALF